MARTTEAEVKKIIDTEVSDIQPFIDTANAQVNEYLTNQGLSSTILTEIEKYLSAHYVTLRDPRVNSEDIGDASFDYDRNAYKEQALSLDSTGKLKQAFKEDGISGQFEGLGLSV